MKKIEAYIKTIKKREVIEALHGIEGLTGLSIIPVEGYGRHRDSAAPITIVDAPLDDTPHSKLEIVCLDSIVDTVIDAIEKGAHTGLRSDGKIYLYDVQQALRISTGERGDSAV